MAHSKPGYGRRLWSVRTTDKRVSVRETTAMKGLLVGAAVLLADMLVGCSSSGAPPSFYPGPELTTNSSTASSAQPPESTLALGKISPQTLCEVLSATITASDLGDAIETRKPADDQGEVSCRFDTAPLTTLHDVGGGGLDNVETLWAAITASSPGYFAPNGVPLSSDGLMKEIKSGSDCPIGASASSGKFGAIPTVSGICGSELGTYDGTKVYYLKGFSVSITLNWAIDRGHRTQDDVDATADRVFTRLTQTQ
jgi:hypothetical protein